MLKMKNHCMKNPLRIFRDSKRYETCIPQFEFNDMFGKLARIYNSQQHPMRDEIDRIASSHCHSLGIYDKKFHAGTSSMSSFLYPLGHPDKVATVSVFFQFLFWLDDRFDEDTRGSQDDLPFHMESMFKAWRTGLTVENESYKNVFDSVLWLREQMNHNGHNEEWFRIVSELLEAHCARLNEPPEDFSTIDEYIKYRYDASGVCLCLAMIEFVNGCYLSPTERIRFERLDELAVHIVGLSNDLVSLPKEKHSHFNIATAMLKLGRADSCVPAIQASIDHITDFSQLWWEEFRAMQRTSLSPCAKLYLDGSLQLVRGFYAWHRDTPRYRDPIHPLRDMRPAEMCNI